ncbi:MAG TPA: tetratricopeptide repeat protein [Bacteroidales bacterium]|nr:tetratricopeptide repeat protein [Bacteroidales bacterium]
MNRFRKFALLYLPVLFLHAMAIAGVPDTAALFRQQYVPDAPIRLQALEKIYWKIYRNDFRKGLPYAWKTLVLADRLGDGPRQIQARFYIASYYYNAHRLDECLNLLIPARQKAFEIRNRELVARSCSFLGMVYQESGDHLKSLRYLRESMKYDTTRADLLARNYLTLGIVFADAGNLSEAAGYYHKSLKLKETLHDTGAITVLYCNLSDLYARIGNDDKALEYNEKAFRFAERSGDIENQAYCMNGLGALWFSKKEYVKALTYYRQALVKKAEFSDYQGMAFVLTNMGEVYFKWEKMDSAESCYIRSLRYSGLSGDKISRCCTYLSMSRLEARRHAYGQAEDYVRKSLQLSEEINYRTCQEEIYGVLSAIADSMGDSRKALAMLQKRNAIKDSVYKEKAQQLVTDMMIRYELDRQKIEMNDLNSEVSLKNRRIEVVTLILAGIMVLVGAVSVVIYRIYRKKLRPKMASLTYIQEKILEEARKDSRRMRSLKKILPPEMDTPDETRATPNGREESLVGELERFMADHKPYLREDLSLSDVAQELKTNTAYLSRLINDTYRENFNTFINRYRVEVAKQLIRDNEHTRLSYEGIAHSVGFRSRSSFYQAFKSITGQTPSEFAASL